MSKSVLLLNLEREPYDWALDLQHRLVQARREGRIEDVLVLLEHEPVITTGRHGDEGHILASREELAAEGIEVYRVERGGDVIYHGPGQLVGYPILDLRHHRLDVGWYMHSLEEVLIRTLRDFGIAAERLEGIIGVWVKGAKIAALGARIENWITYHGFALNVAPQMAHFRLIIPCGIGDRGITSMREALGHPVDLNSVRRHLAQHFADVFAVTIQEVSLSELEVALSNRRHHPY